MPTETDTRVYVCTHQRVGHGQAAHGIVRGAGIGMEQHEVGRRARLSLEREPMMSPAIAPIMPARWFGKGASAYAKVCTITGPGIMRLLAQRAAAQDSARST
jgi:hypothetical protein